MHDIIRQAVRREPNRLSAVAKNPTLVEHTMSEAEVIFNYYNVTVIPTNFNS